jgi:hypothetical protein
MFHVKQVWLLPNTERREDDIENGIRGRFSGYFADRRKGVAQVDRQKFAGGSDPELGTKAIQTDKCTG